MKKGINANGAVLLRDSSFCLGLVLAQEDQTPLQMEQGMSCHLYNQRSNVQRSIWCCEFAGTPLFKGRTGCEFGLWFKGDGKGPVLLRPPHHWDPTVSGLARYAHPPIWPRDGKRIQRRKLRPRQKPLDAASGKHL